MRIITAHIYGYGKLVNRTFNFREGMNLILGYNETGKSTLMSFIKAMLYGHKKNEREGKDGTIPENKKYKPWETDNYGGYLILETDENKILRVERDFNSKSLTVYNEYNEDITNEFSYSKESGMLGQDLLGMDFECFTNSSFMCQDKNLLYPEDKEHIAQKLMNISESGEEQISVGDALKKLKESITFLGNERTSKRKYNILSSQIETEKRQLRIMQEENQRCMEYLTEAEEIKKELKKLETEEKLCIRKETFESVNKSIREYERYSNEINELKEKLSDIDADVFEKRKQEFDEAAKEYDELEKAQKNLLEKEKKNSKKTTLLLIFAILVTAIVAVLSITITIWLLLAAFATIPLITLVFITRKKNKEISNELGKLDNLMETEKELEQAATELKKDDSINDLINRYDGLLNDILKQQDVLDYNALLEKANIYSPKGTEPSFNREQCLSFIQSRKERLAVVNAQLDTYMKSDEQIASQQELIYILENQKQAIKEKQKALDYAINGIEEASRQIKEEIIPKMNQKMSEFLYRITAKNHDNLLTGSSMDLNTEHDKSIRSAYNFSDGTLRQMYLAFRLAASNVFSSKTVTPIFMDETLVYYDRERKKSTFDFIYELSKHNQILFFATDMESSLLKGKDMAVIELSK